MSNKIYYHKHSCPCCDKMYECVLSECRYRDGKEETCSRCWMVGINLPVSNRVKAVVTYAEREP